MTNLDRMKRRAVQERLLEVEEECECLQNQLEDLGGALWEASEALDHAGCQVEASRAHQAYRRVFPTIADRLR